MHRHGIPPSRLRYEANVARSVEAEKKLEAYAPEPMLIDTLEDELKVNPPLIVGWDQIYLVAAYLGLTERGSLSRYNMDSWIQAVQRAVKMGKFLPFWWKTTGFPSRVVTTMYHITRAARLGCFRHLRPRARRPAHGDAARAHLNRLAVIRQSLDCAAGAAGSASPREDGLARNLESEKASLPMPEVAAEAGNARIAATSSSRPKRREYRPGQVRRAQLLLADLRSNAPPAPALAGTAVTATVTLPENAESSGD